MNIIVLQPTVPRYRLAFFDRCAERLGACFTVYASAQDLGVLSDRTSKPDWERPLGAMRRLLPGLFWQDKALSIPLAAGDIVVIAGAPRCLSNIALLIKARLKGAKTIWWGHYWSSTSRPRRAALRMLLMRLSDAILFYTDQEVKEYLAGQRNITKPVSALNNGIETGEIANLRTAYEASMRTSDLLFIGRITPKAELALLLEALSLSPDIRLDIIGSGTAEASLRSRCADLGIAKRVTWHGGLVDETRIAEIANTCKAFVYPGSVGLSLIHAFAYGLPAIVHDNRWQHMPEIAALQVGVNGQIFRQGDGASLAQAIGVMLADPQRLVGMSAAAVATVDKTFNAADMAERFCRFLPVTTGKSGI